MKRCKIPTILILLIYGMACAVEPDINSTPEAVQIKDELRIVDGARKQATEELKLAPGTVIPPETLKTFFLKKSRLYQTFSEPNGPVDLLGNPYEPIIAREPIHLSAATFEAVKNVVPEDFWEPFVPKAQPPRQATQPLPPKLARSMSNAKIIALGCKLYARDHDGSFPNDLKELVPLYVASSVVFSSPFAPSRGKIDYDYFGAGLKDTEPASKILLSDRYAAEDGQRVEVQFDMTGKVTRP